MTILYFDSLTYLFNLSLLVLAHVVKNGRILFFLNKVFVAV